MADRALATGSKTLASATLYELDGEPLKEGAVQARAWQQWLRRRGLSPAVTGDVLLRGLRFLAARNAEFGELLRGPLGRCDRVVEQDLVRDVVEVSR